MARVAGSSPWSRRRRPTPTVLLLSCIDFGFFQRIFPVTEVGRAHLPRRAEAVLAATLLVFLFAYLNLNRWHVRYGHVAFFWLVFLAALVGLAVINPPVAAGVARVSIAAVAGMASCSSCTSPPTATTGP